MSKYHYRSLPSGNAYMWSDTIEYLVSRGVRLEWSHFKAGGVMFRWPIEDEVHFPTENGEPYFGDEDAGWSIFKISDEEAQSWCDDFGGDDWSPCQED